MTDSSFVLLLICVIFSLGFSFSFVPKSPTLSPWSSLLLRKSSTSSDISTVETLSIRSLDSDHETEGVRMASSVALWLDTEWMPQSVHKEIANVIKDSYIAARNANEHEVSAIMFKAAQDLEGEWPRFELEGAFTNPWDVANYVADYLGYRVGTERCECSAKVLDPGMNDL